MQQPHQHQRHGYTSTVHDVPYIPAPVGGHAYLMRDDPQPTHDAQPDWRSRGGQAPPHGARGGRGGFQDPYRAHGGRRADGAERGYLPRREEPLVQHVGSRPASGNGTPATQALQPPHHHHQHHNHQHGAGQQQSYATSLDARGRGRRRSGTRTTPSSASGSSAPITPEQRPAARGVRPSALNAGYDSSASEANSGSAAPARPRPDMSGRRLAQLDHAHGEDKRVVLAVLKEKARNMGLAEATARGGTADDPEEAHRTVQRRKQLLFGKVTTGYRRYVEHVPPFMRHRGNAFHPATPRADVKCSKRRWDLLMQIWRRELHLWDEDQFNDANTSSSERARMLAGVGDLNRARLVTADGAVIEDKPAAVARYREQMRAALDRVSQSVEGAFRHAPLGGAGPNVAPKPIGDEGTDSTVPMAALDELERVQRSIRADPECVQEPPIELVHVRVGHDATSANATPAAAGASTSSAERSPAAAGHPTAPTTSTASGHTTPPLGAQRDPSPASSNSPHGDDSTPPPSAAGAARRRPEPLHSVDVAGALQNNASLVPLPSPAKEMGPPLSSGPLSLILSGQMMERQAKHGGPMAFRVDCPNGGTAQEVFRELEANFHVSRLSFHVVRGGPLPPPMAPVPASPVKSDGPPEPSEHTATPARTYRDDLTASPGSPPPNDRAATLEPKHSSSGTDTATTPPNATSLDDDFTEGADSPATTTKTQTPVKVRTPTTAAGGRPAAMPRRGSIEAEVAPQSPVGANGSRPGSGKLEHSRSKSQLASPGTRNTPGPVRPYAFASQSSASSAPIRVPVAGAVPKSANAQTPVAEDSCSLHPEERCSVYRLNRLSNVAYFLSFYDAGLPIVYLDNGDGGSEGAFKTSSAGRNIALDYWRSVTPLLGELGTDASPQHYGGPDINFRNTVSPDAINGILESTPAPPADTQRFFRSPTPGKNEALRDLVERQTPLVDMNASLCGRPVSRSSPSGGGRTMRHTPGHNDQSQDRDESVARHTARSAAPSPKENDRHDAGASPSGAEVAKTAGRC